MDTFNKLVGAIFFFDFLTDRVNKMNLFLSLSTNAIIIFLKNSIICIESPLFANNIVFLNRNAKQTRLKEMLKVFALKLKKPQNFPTFQLSWDLLNDFIKGGSLFNCDGVGMTIIYSKRSPEALSKQYLGMRLHIVSSIRTPCRQIIASVFRSFTDQRYCYN